MSATSGVDQGDPLASLLFACGLRTRLRTLEEELQEEARRRNLGPSAAHVLAYHDDVVVTTPAELATEVLPTAWRVLGELGLELQPGKTQA